jgi:hypothetical protein
MARVSRWTPDIQELDLQSVQLVVAQARGSDPASGVLSVGDDVADELRSVAAEALEEIAGRTPVRWSAQATLEPDEMWVVQRDQLDDEAPALVALERQEHPDVLPEWLADRSGVVYAIAVGEQPDAGEPDSRVLFVRKRNPILSLARKVTAFWDEALRKIDYPLIAIDRTTDIIVAPGRGLIVLNALPFEQLFRDAPELLARAPQAARQVAAAARMTREAEAVLVEATMRLSRVRRRVLAIIERGHLATVAPDRMRSELKRWGLNPAKHYRKNQLSFSAAEVQLMMKVLNEDLLTGGLTDQHYEVDRKTPLE